MIASGAAMLDSTIQIWSMITGERKSKPIEVSPFTSSFTNYVFALKMLPNGLLASGISYTWLNAKIKIWNVSNGQLSETFECISKIRDLELINNETLASSGDDGTVMLWNLTGGTLIRQFKAHNSSVNKIKIISSHLIATGSLDKTIKIWNVTSGSLERTIYGHTDKIFYSLDRLGEDFLVSGSFDNYINYWRISTGSIVKKIKTASQITALLVV
jgi:WD40 repeat protein